MTQENTSGQAIAERVRAASVSVGGSGSVEALLSNALKERKPLADDGSLYETVQGAQDAASSFVFVPPGTFNESVTIDTAGLTLLGAGRTSLIDGGSQDVVTISAPNVTVKHIRVSNGGSGIAVSSGNDGAIINNVIADESTGTLDHGLNLLSQSTISSCYCVGADGINTGSGASGTAITGCIVASSDNDAHGFDLDSDDLVIVNNIVESAETNGIRNDGSDCVIGGNQIRAAGNYGIYNVGTDNVIFNNRIADSSTNDLRDDGAGTVLDGNLTGVSN